MRTNLSVLLAGYFEFVKKKINEVEFDALYQTNRDLLSGEVDDLLQSLHELGTESIKILSPHILKYLSNESFISYIFSYLYKFNISFIYSFQEDDKGLKNVINAAQRIVGSISPELRHKVSFLGLYEQYDRTIIVAKPGFLIGLDYEYNQIKNGVFILEEIGSISFSPRDVDRILSIMDEYIDQKKTFILAK